VFLIAGLPNHGCALSPAAGLPCYAGEVSEDAPARAANGGVVDHGSRGKGPPAGVGAKAASIWRAQEAYQRYLAMGPKRSLKGLSLEHGYAYSTVRNWHDRFDWPALLSAQLERERDQMAIATSQIITETATVAAEVMRSGVALPYRRVQVLNDIAHQIIERLARDGVYERRLVGVQERLFLREKDVTVLRALLSDVAEETGGRVRQVALLEEEQIKQRALAEGLPPAAVERILERARRAR